MTAPALAAVVEGLLDHYGHEPWWWPVLLPSLDRPDELLLGAVLYQQSLWERVEQALVRLDAAGLATWEALAVADPGALAPLLVGVAYPPDPLEAAAPAGDRRPRRGGPAGGARGS